jgi:glycosyltransferase involved in cell wall biosynthesis
MTPVVSVLVQAYNHAEFLSDCLDSILKQETDVPFEVLIGEDRSGDRTLAIAREYERKHPDLIKVITSTENVGMHANFRRLVDASRGTYLAICEGDDYWNTCDKLALQVDFLAERPTFGAVHTDYDHIAMVQGRWRAERSHWRKEGVRVPVGWVFPDLLLQNFIQTCTLMVRTSLVRAYMDSAVYSADYEIGDWPLCLYVSARSKVGYLDRSTATYRRVPGSATNRGAAADLKRVRSQMDMAVAFGKWAGAGAEQEWLVRVANMKGVLHLAVVAGDVALVRETLNWLREHKATFEGVRARARLFLLRTSPGISAVSWYVNKRARSTRRYSSDPIRPGECG